MVIIHNNLHLHFLPYSEIKHLDAELPLKNVEQIYQLKNELLNCLKEHCSYSIEGRNKPSQYFATVVSQLENLNNVRATGLQSLHDAACRGYTMMPFRFAQNFKLV